jgi:predicted nucleic acid-binding protein
MNIFIDTNIYLSFYHLTSDELEELRKLKVLLEQHQIRLLVPEQVIDEFKRNRENKIHDALKRFTEQKLNNQFPQMCKEYPEYQDIQTAAREFEQAKSELLEHLRDDVQNEQLKADEIIGELFKNADMTPITQEVRERARTRFDQGNPPGKKKSYGDAINWETLLSVLEQGEDLYFISDDKDYQSPLNKEKFDYFLLKEWAELKRSDLIFFQRLSSFLKMKFPHIKLATELEKEILIDQLEHSACFLDTRKTLKRLIKHADLTTEEVNDIVRAAISNNQIYWIINDSDIRRNINKLIDGHEKEIDQDNLNQLNSLFDHEEEQEEALF